MKVSEFLRKLDPISPVNVHLVVTHFPSGKGKLFLFDRDFLRRLRMTRGWSKQYPYSAIVLRIYVRDGGITLTVRFNDKKGGE